MAKLRSGWWSLWVHGVSGWMVRDADKVFMNATTDDGSKVDILCSDAGFRRLPFSASGRRHQSHYQRRQHPGKAARAIFSMMGCVDYFLQTYGHYPKDGENEIRSTSRRKAFLDFMFLFLSVIYAKFTLYE